MVYLASDRAREVTGQIFGVRKNEIFLFSQPRVIRSVHSGGEGWTPQSAADVAIPAMASSFNKLDRLGDIFTWDPIWGMTVIEIPLVKRQPDL